MRKPSSNKRSHSNPKKIPPEPVMNNSENPFLDAIDKEYLDQIYINKNILPQPETLLKEEVIVPSPVELKKAESPKIPMPAVIKEKETVKQDDSHKNPRINLCDEDTKKILAAEYELEKTKEFRTVINELINNMGETSANSNGNGHCVEHIQKFLDTLVQYDQFNSVYVEHDEEGSKFILIDNNDLSE